MIYRSVTREPLDELFIPKRVKSNMFAPTTRLAAFLDGGIYEQEREHFGELHGSWVFGRDALRFACYRLGVQQPPRLVREQQVKPPEVLLAVLRTQLQDGRPDLLERLRLLNSVSSSGEELWWAISRCREQAARD